MTQSCQFACSNIYARLYSSSRDSCLLLDPPIQRVYNYFLKSRRQNLGCGKGARVNMDANDKRKFALLSGQRVKETIVTFALFGVILAPFMSRLDSQSFHGDENYWLRSSKYFKLFFLDLDTRSREWGEYFAYDSMPVGRYIIGFVLSISGHKDKFKELGEMKEWDFSRDYRWNAAAGATPPKGVLYPARLAMAIFGCISCMLVYWLGKIALGLRFGVIATLLLAYNPLMLTCSRRAMVDAPLLCFLTANIVLMMFFYQYLQQKSLRRTFIFAAAIGVNIALAAGTKFNGCLTGVIFLAFCMLALILRFKRRHVSPRLKDGEEPWIIAASLIIAATLCILVFVGMNPYLYHQPLAGTFNMVKLKLVQSHSQQNWFSGAALPSLSQKIAFVFRRTLFPGDYVALGNIFKFPLVFILFISGLTMLLSAEVKYIRNHRRASLRSIILIWVAVTFGGTTTWIPLDWDRYYLPLVFCVVVISGYSISRITEKCLLAAERLMRRLRR